MAGKPDEGADAAAARTATDYANLKADVRRLSGTAKLLVRIGIVVLPLAVIMLQTDSSAMLEQFILSREPFKLYEVTIVLWFACWVFGAPFDVDIQESVLIADGEHGAIGWGVIVTVIGFIVIATIFLYLYKIEAAFQLGLLIFIVANMLAFKVINRRSVKAIERSREVMAADSDSFGLEKLRVVEGFVFGRWQMRRFHVLIGLAAAQLAVACLWRFTAVPRLLYGVSLRGFSGEQVAPFVPAILFTLYAVISEVWIMRRRNSALATLKSLDALSRRYRLVPREGAHEESDSEDWLLAPLRG